MPFPQGCLGYEPAGEANIVGHEPLADRARFAARLAANWTKLRRTRPGGRRVAIGHGQLSEPRRASRKRRGGDTPAGTIEVLKAMTAEAMLSAMFLLTATR